MLNAIIKKLQYKLQQEILLIDAPPEFEPVLTDWKKTATIHKGDIQGKHFNFTVPCNGATDAIDSSLGSPQTL